VINSPIRLVHVVDAIVHGSVLYGKERVVASLLRAQRRSAQVEPHLAVFTESELVNIAKREGVPVTILGKTNGPSGITAMRSLARYVKDQSISLVHAHDYKANVVARTMRVAGMLGHRPIVATCHGWGAGSDRKIAFYHTIDVALSRIGDVTTVTDPAMSDAFPRRAQSVFIANGIPDDTELTALGPPLERAADKFYAGTLGRIISEKGINELIAAAAACSDPNVIFAVAGSGPLQERVATASPNLCHVGAISTPWSYLAGLDVYIQPSYSEGLSMSLLEAMRAGKAIVATDVGATRYAVEDGKSALLIPPRDPQKLLDAVMTFKHNPNLAQRFGEEARRRYERDFRIQHQHETFLKLYSRLLQHPPLAS